MCGITISTLEVPEDALRLVEKRGPDHTNKVTFNQVIFIHHLLQITGETTLQPLIEDDIVVIFNGEIYNYKTLKPDAKSDVYSIMEMYKTKGLDFVKYLDGDFVISIFDFKQKRFIISSDIFATKPLYYSVDKDHIIISSYPGTIRKIKKDTCPIENRYNQLLVFDLESREVIEKRDVYQFDLKQHKRNYNDFNTALEKAILKRYPEKEVPLLNLSSGIDSGVIACVLNKFKKQAIYVTFKKNENEHVIDKRNVILDNKIYLLDISEKEKKKYAKYLSENCENFCWDWRWIPNIARIDPAMEAGSMLAKAKTLEFVKNMNKQVKVCYSGIGADEIMNKARYYCHGVGNPKEFPKDLSSVFPWKNFFEGTMKNYIKGDEYVGGCYSFETRFPYCDKDLVQEFLWLRRELKNKYKCSDQKAPLIQYLIREKFPLHTVKRGFNV